MQRNNSRFTGLAAMAFIAVAAATPGSGLIAAGDPASITQPVARAQPAMPTSEQAAARERAAWLRAGRSTWRRPGYPRPGDSVRQHARKASRRRRQVSARRAARG